jgi:microcystin-dependent protein
MGANTGNYSRNIFAESKRYIQNRVTQGSPWVDADDNDGQQSNFRQHRRIEDILGDGAIGDGFKCTGTGLLNDFNVLGGDGTDDGAGRFFLNGHGCMLSAATTWKNNGATEGGRSLQPRITTISYNSGTAETTIGDSAANWAVNAHAAHILTPDITQPGTTFPIVSNTQTQMIVTGDATVVAQLGDNYRIEMKTPAGSDRNDGVFLNVYLDEFDCTDDPNLIHNLVTATCAQLRTKLIQTLYIQEGAETFSDYVDGDGNQHYVFQIARIHRYDGVDAIWDIDDLRPILSDGHGIYSELMLGNNNLRVVISDPLANTAAVLPGWWTLSDRSALRKFPTKTNTLTFPTVSLPGRTRYDLVIIDDGGNLIIKPGTEIIGTGDPFINCPAPDIDKLCLGIVRVNETASVVISKEDITDAREFLNIGMAANALANFYSALWLRPHSQAIPNDTVRIEAGRYIKSDGLGALDKSAAFNSGVFPVAPAGQERYDLLVMDDSGNPQIVLGTPVPISTGSFLVNCPPIQYNTLTLAVVKVDEPGTVLITSGDILDIREFLNKGGGSVAVQDEAFPLGRAHTFNFTGAGVTASLGGGVATITVPGGVGGCPGATSYQVLVSTLGQTVFNLGSPYVMGTNALWVFRNGARQIIGNEYNETTPTSVTFTFALSAGEQLVFIQMGSTNGNMAVAARQEFIATASQTVFNTAFTYAQNTNELFVWSGGVLQWVGAGNDFVETSPSQITFNVGRSLGERIIIARIGDANATAMNLWEKVIATGGQTVFNLTGSYVPGSHSLQVFRNGKLLTVISEYTETGVSTVTLGSGATVGDVFIFFVAGGNATNSCIPAIFDEGLSIGRAAEIDFVGEGVVATFSGGRATVTIPGAPTGAVIDFAGAVTPVGWLLCDGSTVSRTTYANLFTTIGTTYGAGDLSTTFNVPDLRGRTSIGVGTGSGLTPRALAAIGGEEFHTISVGEMPSHTHFYNSPPAVAQAHDPYAGGIEASHVHGPGDYGFTGNSNQVGAGSNGSHNTMQPFMVMNKIIKT